MLLLKALHVCPSVFAVIFSAMMWKSIDFTGLWLAVTFFVSLPFKQTLKL